MQKKNPYLLLNKTARPPPPRAIESTVRAQLNPSVGNELTEFVNHALNTPEDIFSEATRILGLEP